jgi:ATP-dependent exoDNAse (exonuclease V) beta subunit
MSTDEDNRSEDTAARLRIRHSLDESLLVEAAAGTGKTSELVRRLVSILSTARARPDQIVAVTFTRKAAGELKLRLREELDRTRALATEPSSASNLENAIAQLEEARIGTIHSFCADLLRERPVEARVDPDFQELSEEEAPRVFDQAFRSWMEEKLADMPPGLSRALSRSQSRQSLFAPNSPLDAIKSVGWKLLEWRDFKTDWRKEDFDREVQIDYLVERLKLLSEMSWKSRNWQDDLRKSLRPVRDLVTWIRRAEREQPRDYDRLEGRLVTLLSEMRRPANQKKGRGNFANGLQRQDVIALREELASSLEQFKLAADADLAASLQGEMRGLTLLYEYYKARAGRLDFVDLLVRARDLIRDDGQIRCYFQTRFSHLFLDEFQDTDPVQAEILLLLSADDPAETEWRNVRPTNGKIFLVGDPKQSIYRFRRADVLLYQEVKQVLLEGGAGLVHLTRSYRSVRPIQQLVNAGFAPLMTGDPVSGQPKYVPLDKYRTAPDGQPSIVVLPVPKPYGFRNIANYAIEKSLPDAVGAFVEWLLEESGWTIADPDSPENQVAISPRHICLLFRRFVSWGADVTRDYTRSLESRGVSHVLVGSRSFHEREEVETLRTALAAIEWPDDELSVFAALRGSLFWVPDSLLLRFRHQLGSLHPFKPVPGELDPELHPVVESLEVLATLHRKRNTRSVVETINQLLSLTRAHAGFALRPAGHQVLANLQRVCDRSRRFEAAGTSFRAFVEYLLEEADQSTTAEAPVLEEGVEGVRLMTVHGAKGLEFPIVILADPTCRLSSARPDKFVDNKTGLAAFTVLGCAPWDLIDHQEEERARDEAEGVRLAYVAATRARDLLVVPAVGDEEREGWLSPLNRSIYPPANAFRIADKAEGCPEFGNRTVLDRPHQYDVSGELSVMPGRHAPKVGEHRVVWWDPTALRLDVQANFGLQQEQVLAQDEGRTAAQAGLDEHELWREAREKELLAGTQPELELLTVTEGLRLREPPRKSDVVIEILEKAAGRPTGPRFGTLVHTILRDVGFNAGWAEVRRLAKLHGRLLEAGEAEVEAASEAVLAALDHSLFRKAGVSTECHREYPVLLKLPESEMVEGTIDLAFVENDHWIVVDFKTDADLASKQEQYKTQVQWYAYCLKRITGRDAKGWLLGV